MAQSAVRVLRRSHPPRARAIIPECKSSARSLKGARFGGNGNERSGLPLNVGRSSGFTLITPGGSWDRSSNEARPEALLWRYYEADLKGSRGGHIA